MAKSTASDASSGVVIQSIPLVSSTSSNDSLENTTYTLNKWRFFGIVGLILYNLAAGMSWTWFGSIATQGKYWSQLKYMAPWCKIYTIDAVTKDFHISISQVNWLGNIINIVFLPASFATPFLCNKYGLRRCCFGGAVLLTLSGWIRVAGTPHNLSPQAANALLGIGQVNKKKFVLGHEIKLILNL